MSELLFRHLPSPLRYPGGKGKVANFLKLVFLRNNLIGQSYAELYAGGASVALALLYEEYASHIFINDLNYSIYAFWYSALNDTDALCTRIQNTAVTIDEWHKQKAIQISEQPELLDLAFSTFFLNRTNRSGIISGGVIGGKNQDGRWKLDARYNKPDLIGRIRKIGRYKNRITLTKYDAAKYINNVIPTLPQNTFLYLDPPYYVKGGELYEHFYKHDDHAEIAKLVREIENPWIVSYDAVPQIKVLYAGCEQLEYSLNYSAANRYKGSEVMFLSEQLVRPLVDTPANIDNKVVRRMQQETFLYT